MNQNVFALCLPAKQEYALVARMAMGGLGMLEGLDVDAIGDLQTVTNECFDCLLHQQNKPESISICAEVMQGQLSFCYESKGFAKKQEPDLLALDITRGVLETLVSKVELTVNAGCVTRIACFMPL